MSSNLTLRGLWVQVVLLASFVGLLHSPIGFIQAHPPFQPRNAMDGVSGTGIASSSLYDLGLNLLAEHRPALVHTLLRPLAVNSDSLFVLKRNHTERGLDQHVRLLPFSAARRRLSDLSSEGFTTAVEPRPLPDSALTQLERVHKAGVLTVLTRNSATSYYLGPNGPKGFEYDLAKAFADHLGVALNVVVEERAYDMLWQVAHGHVDVVAAGLIGEEHTGAPVRFGPTYQSVSKQVVYRQGGKRPRSVRDLIGANTVLAAGSTDIAHFRQLKREHPELNWTELEDADAEELFSLLLQRKIDYTVAPSDEVMLHQRFFPELRVGFDLTETREAVWAFQDNGDDSLHRAAREFFAHAGSTGLLNQLRERHYGHARQLNYVGARRFTRHIATRLPKYKALFKQAAEQFALDWRLLAAMAYQESLWDPTAVSPTGVRGLMMLTKVTAREVGVTDRVDPRQSITGGAAYIRTLRKRVPTSVKDPDRTWMALAAYNVGFGHLQDARALTRRLGGDPDRWVDVKERLPLLSKRKWYRQTRHGYARGHEPVKYVQNIRLYYDILVWMNESERNRYASLSLSSHDRPAPAGRAQP